MSRHAAAVVSSSRVRRALWTAIALVLASAPVAAHAEVKAAGEHSASVQVALTGTLESSITLRVVSDSMNDTVELGTIIPSAPAFSSSSRRLRRADGATTVEMPFAIDVHQTGVSCSNVVARLGEASTDAGRVSLIGDQGSLLLDRSPQVFAVVRETRARLPALLSVLIPDSREPGPMAVSAVFEATACSE